MNKALQIVCLTICYFFASNLLAQPLNDDCEDARVLANLNNGCTVLSFQGATFDKTSGTCVPNDYPNAWFEFTAQGADLEVEVTSPVDAYITLFDISQNEPCNDTLWMQEICAVDLLAVGNRLVQGRTYKISVAFINNNVTNYSICINNPQPSEIPPNDFPCGAELLMADGTCYAGHNNNSTAEWLNPDCINSSRASVWYKLFLTPGHSRLKVTLDVRFTGNYSMFLSRFNNNSCSSYPIIVGDTLFCDNFPDRDTVIFENLSANTVYYLQIASKLNATGTFTFCLQELEDASGCGLNDNCLSASDISVEASEPDTTCFSGCNLSALPGPQDAPGTCYFMEHPTVWHVITPDPTAAAMRIILSSTDLQYPQIALYTGDTCSDLSPVLCDFSTDGFLDIALFDMIPGNKYFLAVSDLFGAEGEYYVCIDQFALEVGCKLISSIRPTNTSYGSPLGGPYQSGENVTFCYQVTAWQKGLCNWLQGITPLFGTAWDPTSFRFNGEPSNITKDLEAHVPGDWRWYSQGVVQYNVHNPDKGYTVGTPLPGGWYFTNDDYSQTNPNNSRGDGDNCDLESGVSWEVCFSLKVKDFMDCVDLDDDDASIRIETFADSEIGFYPAVSCLMDQADLFIADLNCCEGPSVADANFNICTGDQFVYDLNPMNDPNLNFNWEPILPDGVFGPEPGSGNVIDDVIFNFTETAQSAIYSVFISDTTGCFGPPATITVRVQPFLAVEAGMDQEVCEGLAIRLGGSPTADGGSGNYTYNWSNGSINQANPFYVVNETEKIVLVVTDSRGCVGSDSVLLEVLPVPRSILNISLCPGDTFEFNGQTITEAGNYESFVNNGAANGCDSIVNAIVILFDEIVLDGETIAPDDGSDNGSVSIQLSGGQPPYSVSWSNGDQGTTISGLTKGDYTATVRDGNNCQKIFTFTVPLMSATREEVLSSTVTIAPNPAKAGDKWIINNNSSHAIQTVKIHSSSGELIETFNPESGLGIVNMLSPKITGLYIIELKFEETRIFKRIIIQ